MPFASSTARRLAKAWAIWPSPVVGTLPSVAMPTWPETISRRCAPLHDDAVRIAGRRAHGRWIAGGNHGHGRPPVCYRASQSRTASLMKLASAGFVTGLPARCPQMLGIGRSSRSAPDAAARPRCRRRGNTGRSRPASAARAARMARKRRGQVAVIQGIGADVRRLPGAQAGRTDWPPAGRRTDPPSRCAGTSPDRARPGSATAPTPDAGRRGRNPG